MHGSTQPTRQDDLNLWTKCNAMRRGNEASGATSMKRSNMSEEMSVDQYLAIRKEAALKIDPDTAEMDWSYIQIMDPYGVRPDLPQEYDQVGRGYFARSPGSDVWVSFYDLPEKVVKALWERLEAFPDGRPASLGRREPKKHARRQTA
jgi:hypothetical protein